MWSSPSSPLHLLHLPSTTPRHLLLKTPCVPPLSLPTAFASQQNPKSPSSPPPLSLTTVFAYPQNPKPPSPPPPVPSFFKSFAATLALSAALLSLRFTSPSSSLALPPPPSLSSPDTADADALRSLLEHNLDLENLPEAISALDRLLPLHPDPKDSTDLLVLKAHLHRRAGDPDAARHTFESLLEVNPLAAEAYQGLLAMALKDSNKDEAEEIYRRVEAAMEICRREGREGELRDLRLVVAQVRVTEKKLPEAIEIYEELAREDPADFRPPLCLGIVYSLMSRKVEAERNLERYRQLVPKENPFTTQIERNLAVMKAMGMKQK